MSVAAAAVFLLTPFALNNFFQDRILLGVGSLVIVIMLAANAWSIRRGRYYPKITFLSIVLPTVFFLDMALRKQGIIGLLWCYPGVVAFYFMLPERMAWVGNAVLLAVAIPDSWFVFDSEVAPRATITLISVSIFSAIFVRVISVQHGLLQTQAVTDSLTGLSNRVLLDTSLEQAIEQNRRTGADMTLVALDLDHFKRINDTLGHDAGDSVLRKIGELFRSRVRRSDKAFRVGGEEFVVLLYGTDLESGRRFAEELRATVESVQILPDCTVTISVGVAALKPGETWREWMKRSDERLYDAKSLGRNRVVM